MSRLTQIQKRKIQAAINSKNFNIDTEIQNLVSIGFTSEDAAVVINDQLDIHRQDQFDLKLEEEQQQKNYNYGYYAILLLGGVGPVFGITSFVWYIATAIIAIAVAYWASQQNPLPSMLGAACFVCLFPATHHWYMEGRRSIIRIELLIPLLMALVPSYIIGLVISLIVGKSSK